MFKIFLSLLIAVVMLTPVIAFASDYGLNATAGAAQYDQQTSIPQFVNRGITAAFSMLLLVFFGIMLYGGLRWMTARGNDEFTTKAKNALTAASIGLVILISAYAITRFVMDRVVVGGAGGGWSGGRARASNPNLACKVGPGADGLCGAGTNCCVDEDCSVYNNRTSCDGVGTAQAGCCVWRP